MQNGSPLVSSTESLAQKSPATRQSYVAWYVAGVLFIIALVIIVILVLTIAHPGDNTAVIISISALAVPAITSLLGFIKSQENSEDISHVKMLVNSQSTNLIAAAEKIALAQGRLQGIAEQIETVRKQAVVALAVKGAGGSQGGMPVVVVPIDALPLPASPMPEAPPPPATTDKPPLMSMPNPRYSLPRRR